MKKILLSIAFAFMGFASAFAAKAYPGPITVMQSDGTELTVYLHGDENFNWTTTADGALLVHVGNNYYVAQIEEDGSLKATPQLAHNKDNRAAVESQAINSQDKAKFFSSAEKELQRQSIATRASINKALRYFPHIGAPKALVILVQFPDCKFKAEEPKTAFNYLFNAETGEEVPEALTSYYNGNNYASVKQYFTDMSKGAFTPTFEIAGVVTVSKSYTYYGQDTKYITDVHYQEMVSEACKLANSELGINFANYDQDNDGEADLVYLVYAGLGENYGGDNNTIWAKTLAGANLDLGNGQKICNYTMASELNPTPDGKTGDYISGIGVFCHEFTHCLGIPDLYPTEEIAYLDNQEPEYWDLMDAGEYLKNGRFPAPFSPWELDVLGWDIDIEELGNTERQITMAPFFQERKVYKITAPDGQYLLLQNIQHQGWWQSMLNHGLLIHKIDYDKESVQLNYKLNNTPGAPNVTILPADGIVICGYLSGDNQQYTQTQYINSLYGDPFPGSLNVTLLTEAKLNNDVTLTNLLYNIKENEDGTITFDYLKDFATGIDAPIVSNETEKDTRIFTLDGRYLGKDANQLNKGIYIINKKKVVVK